MKICILTQPLHTNYGGLLQAYALQQLLRAMGHEPLTEDRQTNRYSPLRRMLRSACVRRLCGLPRYWRADEIASIRRYTDRFIAQNIELTQPIYSRDKRALERYCFDGYIVGSDQVWRKAYSPAIENYFLDFVPDGVPKIAYAASFGLSDWQFSERESRRLAALAARFDLITVREADGVELCRNRLGVDAHQVLDPTLLLDPDAYAKLIAQDEDWPQAAGGGVVSYFLDPTPAKVQSAEQVAREFALELSDVAHRAGGNTYRGIAAEQCVAPPVGAWLAALRSAQFVVTDSFHGVAFSILFNKQFVVVANLERGASRFTSLLSLFGLEERLVDSADGVMGDLLHQKIDYAHVNSTLEQLRAQSKSLLQSSLVDLFER